MSGAKLDGFLDDLKKAPVVAILRGVTPETVLPVCTALCEGGIRFIEVTLNSPRALESIALVSKNIKGIHLGAGTVTRVEEVGQVASAGGRYIISPNVNPAVIRRTKEAGLLSIPGFMTPTEAFLAMESGADLLKCFPVGKLGAGYIKDLRAVLPMPILAVGGVSLGNVAEFFDAGAVGVGLGASLYTSAMTTEEIRDRAKDILSKCR